jgi:hypothetical protein
MESDLFDLDAQHTLELGYPEGAGLTPDDGEHNPPDDPLAPLVLAQARGALRLPRFLTPWCRRAA